MIHATVLTWHGVILWLINSGSAAVIHGYGQVECQEDQRGPEGGCEPTLHQAGTGVFCSIQHVHPVEQGI